MKERLENILTSKPIRYICWIIFWCVNLFVIGDFVYALTLDILDIVQHGRMTDDFLEGLSIQYFDDNRMGIIKIFYIPVLISNTLFFVINKRKSVKTNKLASILAKIAIVYCLLDFISSFF